MTDDGQSQLPIQVPGTKKRKDETTVGPVYQGVCKQIRTLFPGKDEDAQARKARLEGTIAQARSLAASIDRVSGYVPKGQTTGGYQAAGMQLSAMHERLDALLERLWPEDQSEDPFDAWARDLDKEEEERVRGRAETPHPPL